MLTYKCYGSRGSINQISRIEEGFKNLKLLPSETPDFIYSNDVGTHDEAIEFKKNNSSQSSLILNTLDIPSHIIHQYDLEKHKNQLLQADIITCISKFVQNQIRVHFNLYADIIYNPVNNIYPAFPDKNYSKFTYLIAGRSGDINKRVRIALETLVKLKAVNSEILCIGPENPGFGTYLGIVSEKELVKIYNSVKFVFCTGFIEGLGLQKFESLCGNSAIPLVLNDETTFNEFFGDCKDYINIEPNSESLYNYINALQENPEKFNQVLYKLKENIRPFIEENLRPEKVAQKILDNFRKYSKI